MAKYTDSIDCGFDGCDFKAVATNPRMRVAHTIALHDRNVHFESKHTSDGRLREAQQHHELAVHVLKMREDEFRKAYLGVADDIAKSADSIRRSLAYRDKLDADIREPYMRLIESAQRDLLWMIPNTHIYDLPRYAKAVEDSERFVKETAETLRLAQELVAEKVSV